MVLGSWSDEAFAPRRGFRSLFLMVMLGVLGAGCSGVPDPGAESGEETEGAPADPVRLRASPSQPPSADKYAGVGLRRPEAGRLVFTLTNRVRANRGRAVLTRDTTLAQIACWHNQDMLAHGYMGHEDAGGALPSDRMAHEHRRLIGAAGENVAKGDPLPEGASRSDAAEWAGTVLEGWMNSDGHRTNVLRPQFTHVGACATHISSASRATAMFATVWAYLDAPLPWSLSPGDSLTVSIRPVRAAEPPAEYAFVPVGEPVGEAFESDERGHSFRGTLHLPDEPGVYGSRFLFPEDNGRYMIISGPRTQVE